MKVSGCRLREYGDAYMLRYELDSLLWRNDIVSVLGDDRFTSCCIHDRLMHKWMNPFRKQNPLVLCQILENQALFVRSWVSFEKRNVEWSPSEWYGRDLNVLGRRRHECEAQFAHEDAPERLQCKLSH
jgi:hypothetical protein